MAKRWHDANLRKQHAAKGCIGTQIFFFHSPFFKENLVFFKKKKKKLMDVYLDEKRKTKGSPR